MRRGEWVGEVEREREGGRESRGRGGKNETRTRGHKERRLFKKSIGGK